MSRTKIICTIGPASESPEVLRSLVVNGMSVARLNFSHGEWEGHLRKIQSIREISEELGRPVAVLQDLAGPKIRVGTVPEPGIRLEAGELFVLTGEPVAGSRTRVSVSYAGLPGEVHAGDRILLADGLMELVVRETDGPDIRTEVVTGGVLTSRKGINLPSGSVRLPSFTEKDREDLIFGLEHGVDFVALSFVRSGDDIHRVKEIIRGRGMDTPVIAKIEKHEALNELDGIIEAADGIMVARGDLGVEIPLEQVPGLQKTMIRRANQAGKPVITATQMLRSMVDSPRPTRAEAADVANAVLDGTDAVMLSEETASGNHPVEALRFMVRITVSAEEAFPHDRYLGLTPGPGVSESVAHAACVLADHLGAAAVVAPTSSGRTAAHVSRFRPKQPVIAVSPNIASVRRSMLYWGCEPVHTGPPRQDEDVVELAVRAALAKGRVNAGDLLVVTAGHPFWVPGSTNMIRVRSA
ncbi:MAG: pyruvate kinase [Deltaproteobacteria bacterium]|nr:pyruvate kinase [Deltaproteobacteria bacterium]